ncbi:MAG: hypothetical protein CL582_23370 [Alteromonadaceae bacterium]|nr:hypothetical protein [Alteromonadaceae bacterium]|tara:strand:- start:3182 stop:3565 length:384 start_codon:yes stop_codon:yes gene_type:complete
MSNIPDESAFSAKPSTTLLSGDSKDLSSQRKVASLLEEALEFLRFTARTNDYFTGHSLAEVLTERLATIGEDGKDDDPGVFVGSKRTLISRLNYFQELLIGEDGKSGAIGAALEVDVIESLDENEDD